MRTKRNTIAGKKWGMNSYGRGYYLPKYRSEYVVFLASHFRQPPSHFKGMGMKQLMAVYHKVREGER